MIELDNHWKYKEKKNFLLFKLFVLTKINTIFYVLDWFLQKKILNSFHTLQIPLLLLLFLKK